MDKPGMAQNMQQLLFSRYYSCPNSRYFTSPMIRYFSSIKHEIHPFCSLNRLAYDIGFTYKKLSDLFPDLTANKVIDILKRIMDGTYTLSPLRLSVFTKKGDLQRHGFNHIMHLKDHPNFYVGVKPTQEDRIVLMGLGIMLNQNLLMDNSLGLKTRVKDYYGIVCARGNVLRVYKLDLTKSLMTINRESLLCKLSHIVMDGDIMELVRKFLYLPIKNESGLKFNNINIPSSVLITEVLLNFALIEFDKEFQRVFPQLYYNRYIHEVFVYFPTSESKQGMTLGIFEQKVLSLFDQLHLAGEIISIGPGDAPVPCYGGLVCVSQDGKIQVKEQL